DRGGREPLPQKGLEIDRPARGESEVLRGLGRGLLGAQVGPPPPADRLVTGDGPTPGVANDIPRLKVVCLIRASARLESAVRALHLSPAPDRPCRAEHEVRAQRGFFVAGVEARQHEPGVPYVFWYRQDLGPESADVFGIERRRGA